MTNSEWIDALQERYVYDPESGLFMWRNPPQGFDFLLGSRAGTYHDEGYLFLAVLGKRPFAHRAAWLLTHGSWPAGQIDHINGIKDDNRIANLRDVSSHWNIHNQGLRRDNRTGAPGVSMHGSRFVASIKWGGERKHLGSFPTLQEASDAYCAKKAEVHPGWLPGSRDNHRGAGHE